MNLVRISAVVFVLATASAQAMTVEYDIGDYTTSGYQASFLHAASCASGYCMSGDAMKIEGSLSLDFDNPGDSFGSAMASTTDTTFGEGSPASAWMILFTGVDLTTPVLFENDTVAQLLAIDYQIFDGVTLANRGTFYFADRRFGGAVDSPNLLNEERFVLWGNNWVNADGSVPVEANFGWTLGIDLYGKAAAVPEPDTFFLLLLGLGCLGLHRARRHPV